MRPAKSDDSDEVLALSNDKTLRKFSFHEKTIAAAEHKIWFLKKIKSQKCVFLILERNRKIIGQARFDLEKNHFAKVSIGISNKYQGFGYGKMFLHEAIRFMIKKRPQIKTLVANIKQDNVISQKLFVSLGFAKNKELVKNRKTGYEYVLQIHKNR